MRQIENNQAGDINTQLATAATAERAADINNQYAEVDAIMAKAHKGAENGDGEFTPELILKFHACEILMDKEYPENEFFFSVGGVPVISQGDIHTVGAKQKGGKTSLLDIFVSSTLGGSWGNVVKCLVKDMTVLYIDTEMKQVDTQQFGVKAAKMAGVDVAALNGKVHLVNFRPLTSDEMEQGIRYFIKKYKPMLVIIDGIVDLCSNFNDVEASQDLVLNFLMKIAEEHKCAIISVLHTNKTDGYTELRGHLGAYFEQKGVTTIKCDKNDAFNLVTVSFPTHRYAPVPDFHFSFDANGVPVPADDLYSEIEANKQKSKDEQKEEKRKLEYEVRSQTIMGIVKEHGGSVERKVLKEEAMVKIGKAASTVNDVLKCMLEDPTPLVVQKGKVVMLTTAQV